MLTTQYDDISSHYTKIIIVNIFKHTPNNTLPRRNILYKCRLTITHVLICENPRVRIYKHIITLLMKRASAQWRSYLHTNRVHIRMHTYTLKANTFFCISHTNTPTNTTNHHTHVHI